MCVLNYSESISSPLSFHAILQVKILLYLTTTASEDVETQRIGIISVVLPGVKFDAQKESTDVRLTSVLFMKRVYENLPVRACSIHFCFPTTNPFINIFRTVFLMSMGHLRKRMQFHSGKLFWATFESKQFAVVFFGNSVLIRSHFIELVLVCDIRGERRDSIQVEELRDPSRTHSSH